MTRSFRVGCDIGGTFTDFVILDEASGEITIGKNLTTPANPEIGVLDGLAALDRDTPGYAPLTRFLAHATTLVANTVIERRGARTALLTTRGFRDVLELRRHVRVTTYELWVSIRPSRWCRDISGGRSPSAPVPTAGFCSPCAPSRSRRSPKRCVASASNRWRSPSSTRT
jgi:N-methylhydantoinase A/oxoprolinase/acetone carboxylase beta subunit